MEVITLKSFLKELLQIPVDVQIEVKEVIEILKDATNLQNTNLNYIKLAGQKKGENYYRIRVGAYRIGCELQHPNVILITILSRQNIYKKFP